MNKIKEIQETSKMIWRAENISNLMRRQMCLNTVLKDQLVKIVKRRNLIIKYL